MEPLMFDRRRFLGRTLAGAAWMTAVGEMLAHAAAPPQAPMKAKARSIILLWMQGGPSQLETFDPHPGTSIGGDAKAIKTAVKGIEIASGLERTAEEMQSLVIVRSVVSKEGDHERGTYTMKTGFRPDPTVIHPSLGAILCHELPAGKVDIPRFVSILPNQWSGRGGHLGDQYDAFRTNDPAQPVPDTQSGVTADREEQRMQDLDVLEKAFAKGRQKRVEATGHRDTMARARKMMSAEQLKAFDVTHEPLSLRRTYGDTAFGRACLAARRLTEAGVRCVEVTLEGWDTHVNNHSLVQRQLTTLDPALAALVRDLRQRDRLEQTLVIVAGEFGRTPKINPASGRDHWPTGFSVVLAGGGVRGGQVIGETDAEGKSKDPKDPVSVGDMYATVLSACGVDYQKLSQTKIGRTIPFAEGTPIKGLLG